jgi:P pilus assembly chaperone PapD
MKKTKSFLVFAVSLLFLLPFTMVEAQQQLEVTPGKMSFNTNPGFSQTQQIKVRNKANKEQSYIFTVSDWMADENGDMKYFPAGTTPRSCSEWITVSPNLVTLQPNEQATVNVTMLVPEDDASTKWSVIFVQSAAEQTGAEAIDKDVQMGMQLSLRIAIPVYQSPASNTFFKGTLEGLTETINEDGSRTYETKVINLGDKILNCKVYFTISNLETTEEFTSNPIEFSLLPETSKDVEFTHEETLEKGRYSVAAILDYGFNDELEGIQLDVVVE